MITIIYAVKHSLATAEKEWLNEQKIYPSVLNSVDKDGQPVVRFGMVVPPDVAMLVKLRHKLEVQTEYHQR